MYATIAFFSVLTIMIGATMAIMSMSDEDLGNDERIVIGCTLFVAGCCGLTYVLSAAIFKTIHNLF